MKLVIFDAFNTLVTAHQQHRSTFLRGLARAGLQPSPLLLAQLQRLSEGFDHSAQSRSRESYVAWTRETLGLAGRRADPAFRPRIVPALEQLHQAPMVPMPGAEDCLARLKDAGFRIAICSNWGWDLKADLRPAGLAGHIDTYVSSAEAGFRKPHPRIYQAALEASQSCAENAVFVGDNLRTDILGPENAGIRPIFLTSSLPQSFGGEHADSLAAVAELLIGAEILNRRTASASRRSI